MKREDLIKLGVAEDLIDQIMTLHGKGVEKAKADLAAAQTKAETLESQLAEATTAIEGFKKLDIEGVKKAADEYKAQAEQAKKDADVRVAKIQFDHALDQALIGARVVDPLDMRGHLKPDLLKLGDDGTIIGLKEQLEPLQTSHTHLFKPEEGKKTPRFSAAGNPPPADPEKGTFGSAIAEAMNLSKS